MFLYFIWPLPVLVELGGFPHFQLHVDQEDQVPGLIGGFLYPTVEVFLPSLSGSNLFMSVPISAGQLALEIASKSSIGL